MTSATAGSFIASSSGGPVTFSFTAASGIDALSEILCEGHVTGISSDAESPDWSDTVLGGSGKTLTQFGTGTLDFYSGPLDTPADFFLLSLEDDDALLPQEHISRIVVVDTDTGGSSYSHDLGTIFPFANIPGSASILVAEVGTPIVRLTSGTEYTVTIYPL